MKTWPSRRSVTCRRHHGMIFISTQQLQNRSHFPSPLVIYRKCFATISTLTLSARHAGRITPGGGLSPRRLRFVLRGRMRPNSGVQFSKISAVRVALVTFHFGEHAGSSTTSDYGLKLCKLIWEGTASTASFPGRAGFPGRIRDGKVLVCVWDCVLTIGLVFYLTTWLSLVVVDGAGVVKK